MTPEEPRLDSTDRVTSAERKGGAAGPIQLNISCPNITGWAVTNSHDPGAGLARHPEHVRVVAVEYGQPAGRQRPDQLSLLLASRLDRLEPAAVLAADAGHHRDIRSHQL